MDYLTAGVDIEKGNRLVSRIKELISGLPSKGVISSIGSFGALVGLRDFGCDLVLSSSTDGVGTKLLVAQMAGIHNTVGIDLVAMNVNDIITTGTEPLFFLDYISYSDVDDHVLEAIVEGIVEGLRQASCALVGGETAQMPGMYEKGVYDLSGFCVGLGNGKDILPKDFVDSPVLVGFASSGFHSNGYSLLRKVFFEIGRYNLDSEICGRPLGEILLKPTRIYVELFKKIKSKVLAAVHITGGGFYENIPRVLSNRWDAVIEKSKIPSKDIFTFVKDLGKIDDNEMFKTFNMGIGLIVVCKERDASELLKIAKDIGIDAYKIGYLEKGEGSVKIV